MAPAPLDSELRDSIRSQAWRQPSPVADGEPIAVLASGKGWVLAMLALLRVAPFPMLRIALALRCARQSPEGVGSGGTSVCFVSPEELSGLMVHQTGFAASMEPACRPAAGSLSLNSAPNPAPRQMAAVRRAAGASALSLFRRDGKLQRIKALIHGLHKPGRRLAVLPLPGPCFARVIRVLIVD